MADLRFTVTGQSESATRIAIGARNFTLVVDEPPSLGGEDRGANPVEYLLASYVGCLNVMAHLIAAEQGIKIHSLRIEASGPLNPARLFGQPSADRAGYKNIEVIFHRGERRRRARTGDLAGDDPEPVPGARQPDQPHPSPDHTGAGAGGGVELT